MPRRLLPQELIPLVGTSRSPLFVDVRRPAALSSSPVRVAGAIWRDHMKTIEWLSNLPNRGPTVVCEAPGLKTGLPEPSVWVTRERPKIDRIACPWLIRRFIDPLAVFHFVAAEWVKDIADETGWIPYDIKDVFYSHRGETCTFDTLISQFGLTDPALLHLANIVRGADTAHLDLEPQAAGLLAISLGLSAIEEDDLQQMEKGMTIYDALYGWCRYATAETHNWPVKAA
jgi:hypothetical protein